MKQEVLDCLQKGATVLLRDCTLSKVFDALPFFQNIVSKGYKVKLVPNNNWFWSKANQSNRLMLMRDITFIKHFRYGDKNYELVMNNADAGKYGIMKPVKREWTAPMPDTSVHNNLLTYFHIDNSHPERLVYKSKINYGKLDYSFTHSLTFEDFEVWVLTEQTLGIPINFVESQAAYGVLYGDISELKNSYMSKAYFDIKEEMRCAVADHRNGLPNRIDELIEDYKNAFEKSQYQLMTGIEYELIRLCQVPEGCSSPVKAVFEELQQKCQKVFNDYENLPF